MAGTIYVEFGYHQKRFTSTDQQVKLKKKFGCNVALKTPCDIVHPIFIIDRKYVTQITRDTKAEFVPNFAEINWCYCETFLRYYWISRVVYLTNDLVEVHCDCDELATRQDLIETLDGYVLYCSDKKVANTAIDDGRLVPEIPLEIQDKPLFETPIWDWTKKTFMVTVTILRDQIGVNATWAMSPANFEKLSEGISEFITGQDSSTLDTVGQWVAKTFGGIGSIVEYIKSIVIVPFDYDKTFKPDGENWVKLANVSFDPDDGDVTNGILGVLYKEAKILTDEEDCELPVDTAGVIPVENTSIGSTNSFPYFLRSSKYYCAGIKHPGGILYFDTNCFCDKTINFEIYVWLVCDALTGKYVFEVWAKDTFTFLGSGSGSLGIELNLWSSGGKDDVMGNIVSNVVPIGLGALSQALNTSTTKSPTVQTGASDEETTDANASKPTSKGTAPLDLGIFGQFFPGNYSISRGPAVSSGNGWVDLGVSSMYIDDEGELAQDNAFAFRVVGRAIVPSVCKTQEDYDKYAAIHGYPVSKVLNITDDKVEINNYIQWSNMSCDMSNNIGKCMLPEEVSQLNTLMNSGIYYEGTSGD